MYFEGQITSQNSIRDFCVLKSRDFFCDFFAILVFLSDFFA